MLGFKDYLNEMTHVEIDVQPEAWIHQLDKMNEDLEKVTAQPFLNSALFVNMVRGTLERYGILLPPFNNMQQLSMEAEVVYALGESGHFVYMVHNLDPHGNVEGYAQVVTQDDLDALGSMDAGGSDEGYTDDGDNTLDAINRMRRQVRRSNDDSGNNDEYA
jgi:hypothetical protein